MSSNQNVLRSYTYQDVLASLLFIVVMMGMLSACGSQATSSPAGSSGTSKVVPSPNAGLALSLRGVTALSASDIWAVGDSLSNRSGGRQTLIEHWNGSTWSIVPSPTNPGAVSSELSGVTALSASDVWALGGVGNGTLIEHWNGTRWSVVKSPV